jgi:glycosyltransferase involved in cell wall biosynthesis
MSARLGIVIPAFKPHFLENALQSLELQSIRDFQVYIGDDASPHDLWSIARPFVKRNDWVFHRFEENMGAGNLVGHWNRCVALIGDEDWLWLFSDDDAMAPDCVEAFYKELENHPQTQVFKFPFSLMDGSGQIIQNQSHNPNPISAFEFGKLRFERKLLSSAVEFIFSKKAYDQNGGFINFPAAWCSDDASWMAFAGQQNIVPIQKGRVFWRLSEENISNQAGRYAQSKLRAGIDFIVWFNNRFSPQISRSLRGEQIIWFRLQIEKVAYDPGFFEVLSWLGKLKNLSFPDLIRAFNELYFRCHFQIKPPFRSGKWKMKISVWLPKF